MDAKRLQGPDAGVRKYDVLTALAVAGLAGSASFATSMLRLIALVTARYNWRHDELSIGHAELARMWSVDPRTVKREIRRLRDHGVLILKRPGVRGRVASYRLDHTRIDALSTQVWKLVGPDYEDRMRARSGPEPGTTPEPNVVPFPNQTALPSPPPAEAMPPSPWGRVRAHLVAEDAARFAAWFAVLKAEPSDDATLILRAPSRFHANYVRTHLLGILHGAAGATVPAIRTILIRHDD